MTSLREELIVQLLRPMCHPGQKLFFLRRIGSENGVDPFPYLRFHLPIIHKFHRWSVGRELGL
jgi:hypothetical protein